MLTRFDDYPIHQTPDPIAMPASSDRDVYERYWFNGYTTDESLFFAIATAYYPHIGVRDCALSVIVDGVQHSFHASCRAGDEPTDLTVGPWTLEITEPMRRCRIVLADNETGITADLAFEGRTGNVEEPRHHFMSGIRRAMDTTRFTQLGRWTGTIGIEGDKFELSPPTTLGTKDRSWGLRTIAGGDPRPAPGQGRLPGLFFLWAPLHFDDLGVHYQLFEDAHGRSLFSIAAMLPQYDSAEALPGVEDPAVRHMRNNVHHLTFAPGSRMIDTARLGFQSIDDRTDHEVELEKIFTFRMKGIGYGHPEWGHGMWKGDLAIGSERWVADEVDQTEHTNQHVQHFVRARLGERTGIGALEQMIVGPYAPYGLTGLFDPAPSASSGPPGRS